MPARPGTKRGGIGSVSSRQNHPLPHAPLDRYLRPHARTIDRIRSRTAPDRILPADRPSKTPPIPTDRPTSTKMGDGYRKRRNWESCSVLPTTSEAECWLGRAHKEEGFQVLRVYITPHQSQAAQTRLRAAFGVVCAGARLLTQSFVSSSASAGLIFHGTLFHEATGQTLYFLNHIRL